MRCFQFFILIVFGIWYSVPPVQSLRLTRVSVPAFKKKGESAFLECKYELKKLRGHADLHGLRMHQKKQQLQNHEGTEYDEDNNEDLDEFLDSEEIAERLHRQRTKATSLSFSSSSTTMLEGQKQQQRRTEGDIVGVAAGTAAAAADDKFYETSEALYSVKWYKDNEEFYRYLPKSNPPQHSYRVEGIRVDHQYSDSTKVTLRGLNIKSSGMYRCEVSAEAPSFDSVQAEGRMTIVQLPKEGPRISGEENQYQIGDLLALNCTSGRSHPASMLHWYINDKLVINPDTLMKYPHHHHPQGLITTILGLEMDIESHHFQDGEMRVKCVASVSPVLWQGDKENVFRRRMLEHQETMLLVRSGATATRINDCVSLLPAVLLVLWLINFASTGTTRKT